MRMTIGSRLVLGFGLLVLLAVGVGLYSLNHLADISELTTTISDHEVHVLRLVRQVGSAADDMTLLRERELIDRLRPGGGRNQALQAKAHEAAQQTQALLTELGDRVNEYQQVLISPERQVRWQRIAALVKDADTLLSERVRAVESTFAQKGDESTQGVQELEADTVEFNRAFDAKISDIESLIDEIVQLGKVASATTYRQARTAVLLALALAVVLGGGLGVAIHRSIVSRLGAFVVAVEQIGRGDLTQKVPVAGDDELSALGRSLNQMVEGLREVAGQTQAATEGLSSAAAEILASTQQQVAGTGEQAAAVQQTTATMNEISQSGEQISEQAREVATTAEATATASKAGSKAISDITGAMVAIREQAEAVAENVVALSERTQAVGEIIATVNDIAEQSNLLALNAAIEAAAAGEQGRSFAVVAAKLNSLAEQSKEATVQVRSILGEIQKGINTSVMLTEEAVKRVETGNERAGVAGATITAMAGSIEESVHAFQQIVAATNQQQIGFEQVAEALQNIAQATSQTAASTRQLEKAASSLNALGQQLRQNVARYRL